MPARSCLERSGDDDDLLNTKDQQEKPQASRHGYGWLDAAGGTNLGPHTDVDATLSTCARLDVEPMPSGRMHGMRDR